MNAVARLLLAATLLFAPLTVSFASAACAGGALEHPEHARIGQTAQIVGDGFFRRCNDTPGPCSRGGVSGEYSQLDLVLVQGSLRALLASVSTQDFDFEAEVLLPRLADDGVAFRPGRASFRVIEPKVGRILARSSVRLVAAAPR